MKSKRILPLLLAGIYLSSNLQQTHAMIIKSILMEATEGIDCSVTKLIDKIDLDEKEKQELENAKFYFAAEQRIKEKYKKKREDALAAAKEMEDNRVFKNSMSKLFENISNNTDMQYILDALNLLDPYIYNLTEITENFRFFDGYKQDIGTTGKEIKPKSGIPVWDYAQDYGDGSPNFMRCLFPSCKGTLDESIKKDDYARKIIASNHSLIYSLATEIINYANIRENSSDAFNIERQFSKGCKPSTKLIKYIIDFICNHRIILNNSENIEIEKRFTEDYKHNSCYAKETAEYIRENGQYLSCPNDDKILECFTNNNNLDADSIDCLLKTYSTDENNNPISLEDAKEEVVDFYFLPSKEAVAYIVGYMYDHRSELNNTTSDNNFYNNLIKESFTEDCKPTPELVAQIIGYIHNHVRYNMENKETDLKALLSNSMEGKPKERYERAISYLIENAKIMIENQEDNGQDTERILPKYTPERMLMCYFIRHFEKEEDVIAFYKKIKEVILKPSSQDDKSSNLKSSCDRLKNINKILARIKSKDGDPILVEKFTDSNDEIALKNFLKNDNVAQALSIPFGNFFDKKDLSRISIFNDLFCLEQWVQDYRKSEFYNAYKQLRFLKAIQDNENGVSNAIVKVSSLLSKERELEGKLDQQNNSKNIKTFKQDVSRRSPVKFELAPLVPQKKAETIEKVKALGYKWVKRALEVSGLEKKSALLLLQHYCYYFLNPNYSYQIHIVFEKNTKITHDDLGKLVQKLNSTIQPDTISLLKYDDKHTYLFVRRAGNTTTPPCMK